MTAMPSVVELIECPQRQDPVPPGPCAMVVFGASGDLTSRLLVPALYNMERTGLVPQNFALIGVARSEASSDAWRGHLRRKLEDNIHRVSGNGQIDEEAWARLAGKMVYVQGDLNKPECYEKVRAALDEAEKVQGTKGNAIFYLALAEQFFAPAVDHLREAGLAEQPRDENGDRKYWRRVVFEKPFGHSLESARALNKRVLRSLDENQVFRIDHFLGKETVQNIMALRFANGMFEPIWNRDRIDHVQVTVAETVGVETRGAFYETTGALRDMAPNHLLALISMIAMEPPAGFDHSSVRSKKADVFKAMRPIRPDKVVRAQYGAGVIAGKRVAAYRDEPNVARDSKVETYVAMQLEIDNWRWAGVPFFIRTGKHLARRKTEVAIRFKQAPAASFRRTPVFCLPANWLIISIAPDEGISLQFAVKRPGPEMDLAGVRMDFRDKDWFPPEPNVGYETLLYDVMLGDPTLFMRADMVEDAWRVVEPALDDWAADGSADITSYVSGSEGPLEADGLLAATGNRVWRSIG